MSRQWVRNAPGGKTCKPHGQISKASGDSAASCTRPSTRQTERAKSSKDIPKSVRLDLENALVGLCDLWFDEIKPHLIRNNIKLHVDKGLCGPAGDDNGTSPAEAGCSHNNPGAGFDKTHQRSADFADCCSMRRTASKMQFHKQPASPDLRQETRLEPQPSPTIQTIRQDKRIKQKTLKRKSRKVSQPVDRQNRWNRVSPVSCTVCNVIPRESPKNWPCRSRTAAPYTRATNNFISGTNKKTRSRAIQTDWSLITNQQNQPKSVKVKNKKNLNEFFQPTHFTSPPSSKRIKKSKERKVLSCESLKECNSTDNKLKLRVLFKSPVRDDSHSSIYTGFRVGQKKNIKKRRPWK